MTNRNVAATQNVSLLDKCWHARHDVDIAVLHTERMTDGHIGNKAFKMAGLLSSVRSGDRVLSFGGAWSNHLHALAYLSDKHRFSSVGVVRADPATNNVMMQSMRRYGMRLHLVSRSEYRHRDDREFAAALAIQLGCNHWLPEGGSTRSAVTDCREIGRAVRASGYRPTHVVIPVGTGATLAGVVMEIGRECEVIGLPVVRDDKVGQRISQWLAGADGQWRLDAPLAPGYGKVNSSLIEFIVDFYTHTRIVLDPVYTGKSLLNCFNPSFLAAIPPDARILFVHTGGLVGNYGFVKHYRSLATASAAAFLDALDTECSEHLL